MKRNPSPGRPRAEPPSDDDPLSRIIERPDGFHWMDAQGHQEFGPFASVDEALADMEGPRDVDFADEALVDEAEQGLRGDIDVEPPDPGELPEDD